MVATGVSARSPEASSCLSVDGFQVVESKKKGKKTSVDIAHEQTQQSLKILFSRHIGSGRRDPRVKRATKELSEQPPWAYTAESVALDNGLEFFYHPDIYKTTQCHGGAKCHKKHKDCPFLHPGELFEPFWRCRGSKRANGEYVPPHSITYLMFKHLMVDFKVRENGKCTCTDPKHKRDRCELYHDESDVRDGAQLNSSGQWKGLAASSSAIAVALTPQRYKTMLCAYVGRSAVCNMDRMCTFMHSDAEAEKVSRYWDRLRQELLDATTDTHTSSARVRRGSAAMSVGSDQCSLGASTCTVEEDHVAAIRDCEDLLQATGQQPEGGNRVPEIDLFWRLPTEPVEAFLELCTKTLSPAPQPTQPFAPCPYQPTQPLAPCPHQPAQPLAPCPHVRLCAHYAGPAHAPGTAASPTPLPASRHMPSAHPHTWSVDDVEWWVVGLEDSIVHSAAPTLRAHGVSGSHLAGLDHTQLQAMGVVSFGVRHKLLAAIRTLQLHTQ